MAHHHKLEIDFRSTVGRATTAHNVGLKRAITGHIMFLVLSTTSAFSRSYQ